MFTARRAAVSVALSEPYLEKLPVDGGEPEFLRTGSVVRVDCL